MRKQSTYTGLAVLLLAGCAGPESTGKGVSISPVTAIQPREPSPGELATYHNAAAFVNKANRTSNDDKEALALLDTTLRNNPDFSDALTDKAWILATSVDPTIRDPVAALEFANQAIDALARHAMYRSDRDQWPSRWSPARFMSAMMAAATAMAGQGKFALPAIRGDTNGGVPAQQLAVGGGVEQVAAMSGGLSALAISMVVMQMAVAHNAAFGTSATQALEARADQLLKDFQASTLRLGQPPIADLSDPSSMLR